MKTTDKTIQKLKDRFDELGEVEAADHKRELREARKKLKQAIHKRERNLGKSELRHQLNGDTDPC